MGPRATRGVLITVAIVGFAGLPYAVLVPGFTKDILGGDSKSYGLLLAASGVGALIGGIYLASRINIRGSASRIVVSGVVAAACLAAFAFSSNFWVSMALMLLASMNMMLMLVSSNALVQSIVPDDKRARVMSLYAMAVMGTTPFGYLIVGKIASQWGPRPAMLLCAGGCLLGALFFIPWLGVVRAAIRAHVGHPALRPGAAHAWRLPGHRPNGGRTPCLIPGKSWAWPRTATTRPFAAVTSNW